MINDKSVLAITLARGGSKGITKKNIAPINNKPLLSYTIDEVIKSKYIDKYIVSTDDDDIEQVCLSNNVECFRRVNASNSQTSADGLIEVLDNVSKYDYVIEVMCTNPLKTIEDIDGVIYKDLEPPAYVRNGSIYAMTYNQITLLKRRLGSITRPYVMDESRTINIDEPRDLILAKFIMENENK